MPPWSVQYVPAVVVVASLLAPAVTAAPDVAAGLGRADDDALDCDAAQPDRTRAVVSIVPTDHLQKRFGLTAPPDTIPFAPSYRSSELPCAASAAVVRADLRGLP